MTEGVGGEEGKLVSLPERSLPRAPSEGGGHELREIVLNEMRDRIVTGGDREGVGRLRGMGLLGGLRLLGGLGHTPPVPL